MRVSHIVLVVALFIICLLLTVGED
jgi:hypothetical protein